MMRRLLKAIVYPAMIVLWATVAGCADKETRPPALHGRWQRTVGYPGLTLHTKLYLAPDGALSHSVDARLVTAGDTLCYRVSIRGQWYLQRSLSEFRLLQARYDPGTLSVDNPATGTAVLKATPPTWDALDAYLLNTANGSTAGTTLPYPFTLLELTDTTTSLTGLGAYSNVVRLTRDNLTPEI